MLVSGGGWVSRINWKQFGVTYKASDTLYPVKNGRYFLKMYKEKLEGDTLLVVHDYWVHQWFKDMRNVHVQTWKDKQKGAIDAYNKRCNRMIPWLAELFKIFTDWDIYITSDHSELMWEVKDSYHHNYLANDNPMIREIPLISIKEAPLLNYSQLFTVSDIDDLIVGRPKQLKIRNKEDKYDSIKYINDNVHI